MLDNVELTFALGCQIAASIATLFSMWLMGNKSVKGPLVGALTQIFWFAMVISNGLWGLLPFTIIVTLIHLRNLIKWRREDRDQRKTTQMVQSKVHGMFEGIHVVLDELMNRRDLADPTQVSIAIKQMELAETIFVKSLKIKEKNNV